MTKAPIQQQARVNTSQVGTVIYFIIAIFGTLRWTDDQFLQV